SLFGLASLSLYLGQAGGNFRHLLDSRDTDLKVGSSVSALVLADLNQDGRLDLLVTSSDGGDLSVFLNDTHTPGTLPFQTEERVRAGAGPYGPFLSVATLVGNQLFGKFDPRATFPNLFFVTSSEATRAAVSGDFTGDGLSDLIAVNSAANTVTLLAAKTR